MLKPVRRLVIGAPLFAGLLMAPTGTAAADSTPTGGATRCHVNVICAGTSETTTKPPKGGGGTGGTGSGPQVCSFNGQTYACYNPEFGWFSSATGYYYRLADPQPPAGDPLWEGHKPEDGGVYAENRLSSDGSQAPGQFRFFAQPPAGPPPDNPVELAKSASEEIVFPDPVPGIAPEGTSVVGVPVWFWLANPQPPAAKTARGNVIAVTVTPRLKSLEWSLGDQLDPKKETVKTCEGAGTPYEPKYGATPSPTCGHVFTTGSGTRKAGLFYGTLTVHWVGEVTITGGTQTVAPIDLETSVRLQFPVAEVQVLN
ncbi:hypothetical protein [Streptomyces sp. XY431]|uniref:hypothetical protein n=1 Tax=Streptomyces sp. XY431 TaxID=1415562 RepID=UPI000A4170A8|nr:hypothetical protein [Streptomyces sp. XY431]